MFKSTLKDFIKISCVFGVIALVATLTGSVITGDSLMTSDNPYLMGYFFASLNTIAALIYFLVKKISVKHRNAITSIVVYFLVFVTYCFLIEFSGGEAAGWGYMMLIGAVIFLPVFIILIRYSNTLTFRIIGLTSLVIFLAGYIHMIIGRMHLY